MSDNASPKPGRYRPPLSKAIATGKASLGSVCSSTCTASLKGHWHGAVRRTSLLAERKELASGEATDNDGKVVSATEASEVIASIDTKLAALAREQVILEQHCTAFAPQAGL